MELFSAVQVAPNPDRHGKLYYTLPWSVLDFFDLGTFFINERDHIDQDGHTTLESLVQKINQLVQEFDETCLINTGLLGKIIPLLREIEAEEHPIKIFYPQIYAKVPPLDRGAEAERIESAQVQARQRSLTYKQRSVELLNVLVPKLEPGRGEKDAVIISRLVGFAQLCEEATYEQHGLVAKVLNFASKKLVTKAQEIGKTFFKSKTAARNESCGIAGRHPLVELLTLLSDQTIRSGVAIEAKVKDALPRLEQYHPCFNGVQKYVEARVKAPFKDFRALRQALHQFLMLQWIPKVNPEDYLQQALVHVYSVARRQDLVGAPPPHTPERVELAWMLRGIEDVNDETSVVARSICTAQIGYENELMKLYEAALRERRYGIPPLNKPDQEKLEWASKQVRSPSAAHTAKERLNKAATEVEHDCSTTKKVAWAKNHLKAVWADKYIRTQEPLANQELGDAIAIVLKFQEAAEARAALFQNIGARAIELQIGSAPGEEAPPQDIAVWVNETLDLSDYLDDRDFVRAVYQARGTVKTPEEIDDDLLDFYDRSLRLGVAGVPDECTETSWKIEWSRKVINGEIPCDKEALDPLIIAIREDIHDQFVITLVHFHGALRRDSKAPASPDKRQVVQWGQKQVKGCFVQLFNPDDPEGLRSADLVWMATAHYQQLEELHNIRAEILRQKATENIETILHSINLLIKALEMQPDLMAMDRAQELSRMVVEPTLDWITVAHDFLRSGQDSTLKQGEVDQQFEPIYRDIREAQALAKAGSYLEAFKKLKILLEKSPLSTSLLEKGMDRTALDNLERAFSIFLKEKPPQKPSPLKREVLGVLGKAPETPLTKEVLVEGVELQRTQMVSNGLVLAGYKILEVIFRGPTQRSVGLRQSFTDYRGAIDTIAGAEHDYNPDRVDGAIRTLIRDSGYPIDSEEGQALIARVRGAINSVRRRFNGRLDQQQAQEALHEATYQNLIDVLITVNTENHTIQSHIARGFLPLILWAIKLFVDPFSRTLISKFTEDIILESNGQLTDTHLHPINGLNQGLGMYNEKMRQWGAVTERNAVVDGTLHPSLHDVPVSGQSAAMGKMLEAPRTYPGKMTHTQIDQWGLYIAVDQYLHVAHLCQDIDGMFEMIQLKLAEKSSDIPALNGVAFALKSLLSTIPYMYVWGQYMALKLSEILINFSLQQIAKFAIWYTQAGTEILMRFINALVKSSGYTTGLDKILLEKLRDLEHQLEVEARLAKMEDRGPSSVNNEPIRSLLSHIKETVETIKCDTPQEARDLKARIDELLALETFTVNQVKQLVVPIIISTIESFLNQESMLLALYRGLGLLNMGLREETPELDEAQREELRREVAHLEREVTPEDVADKVQRVHRGLKQEMETTLKRILENAAYPTIDKKIDKSKKFPGQVVSECIGWLEKSLYERSLNGGLDSENIVVLLEARLEQLDVAEVDRNEVLRGLYMDFSHFIKELREHQADIDENRSYNGILLRKDVIEVIAVPLNHLSIALAQFIKAPEEAEARENVNRCIVTLKEATTRNRPKLNQLRESEKWNHDERHRGVIGQTVGSWERLFTYVKEQAKEPIHAGLNKYVGLLAQNLTDIPKKPVLVQHLVRSMMVPYITTYQ